MEKHLISQSVSLMKISFTTLGSPEWDLDTVIRKGAAMGFDGVDFRGLQDTIDITLLPEFTTGLAETRRKFNDAGLAVCGISSSIRLCEPEKRGDNLEEARRTITLCQELEIPQVRVFGRGDAQQHSKEELADLGRGMMEELLELDGADRIQWLFETHDVWIKAGDCKLLLDRIPQSNFGALWDMGHTSRVGGESPQESHQAMGARVGYVHLKDAVYEPEHPEAMKDGWRYVVPGTGQLPLEEEITLLQEAGYDGWIMFEHEKRWHPQLEEPEEIFPKFIAWIRPLLIG